MFSKALHGFEQAFAPQLKGLGVLDNFIESKIPLAKQLGKEVRMAGRIGEKVFNSESIAQVK